MQLARLITIAHRDGVRGAERVRPRPDKKKSNFSRTVLATIMELAEGMDIEELQAEIIRTCFWPAEPWILSHCLRGLSPQHAVARVLGALLEVCLPMMSPKEQVSASGSTQVSCICMTIVSSLCAEDNTSRCEDTGQSWRNQTDLIMEVCFQGADRRVH